MVTKKSFSRFVSLASALAILSLVAVAQNKFPVDQFAGKQVPKFAMKDLSGKTITSDSLKGKVTLIDFWATWCTSCKQLTPGVQRLHDAYKGKGVVVIGAAVLDRNVKGIKDYPTKGKYTFPFTMGEGADKLAKDLKINALPAMIVIDKKGKITHVETGFDAGVEARLEAAIKKAL